MTLLNRLYDNKFQEKIVEDLCFDTDDLEWFYRQTFNEFFDELRENSVEKLFDKDFIDNLVEKSLFDCDDFEWHIRGRLYELVDAIKGDIKIEN